MPVTNPETGTRVDEIADGIYRISTPATVMPGGFTFNQYLIDDEAPLLFHTGPRKMFPLVREAVASVLPVERLRHLAFSHLEADECGALNDFLAAAPESTPACSRIGAMVSIDDLADRPARGLDDGEEIALGRHTVRWLAAPHLPHGWDCGYLYEATTRTLLCGDLFTQGGGEHPAVTESDILGPSEALREGLDYFAHTRSAPDLIEKLAATGPEVLGCMHGPAWRGDGAALLRALGDRLS